MRYNKLCIKIDCSNRTKKCLPKKKIQMNYKNTINITQPCKFHTKNVLLSIYWQTNTFSATSTMDAPHIKQIKMFDLMCSIQFRTLLAFDEQLITNKNMFGGYLDTSKRSNHFHVGCHFYELFFIFFPLFIRQHLFIIQYKVRRQTISSIFIYTFRTHSIHLFIWRYFHSLNKN